ncbi:hypothetical protein JOQ06_015079 [Pogonophryne albipinna]|uniref:Ig-like domain-containing protein n=1 Tax=Pogonophryne albipinna TaxID=1090488 RepID=A0AAD6AM48_9TELE|nr:hypothetical protein JOQ06_015079 [Pogonophryne albipinna]
MNPLLDMASARPRRAKIKPREEAAHFSSLCKDKDGFDVKFINSFKGRGVFSCRPFQNGDFLIEYRGEVITKSERENRQKVYHNALKIFMFDFRLNGQELCVDAAKEDNSLGRLVNDDHVNPNCKMKLIKVDGKPHLCLFALKDISPGEEIAYDYSDSDWPWRCKRGNMFGVGLQFLFLRTCGVTLGQEHGAVRVVVLEGGEALFPVSINRSAERLLFDWKKVCPGGGLLQEVFMYDDGIHYNNGRSGGQSPQFKGRVSHFPAELRHGNASIVISNTTAADRGNYTCYFPRLQPPQTFYFELDVAATPKPSVTILNATADWALLQCEVPGASLNTKAEWQSKDGNRLDAEEERVPEEDHDHIFISLSVNVTRTDLYLCVVSQEDIKHRVSAETFVFINAATPKPRVMILTATADWALLQCEVPGASLNTKAEWQSKDGNRLDAEEERVPEKDHDHIFISLSAKVTRTDLYLCVVSQEDIKHRVSAETFVFINEKEKKVESENSSSTGAMVTSFVLGAVILAAALSLLVCGKCIKINKDVLHCVSVYIRFSSEVKRGDQHGKRFG